MDIAISILKQGDKYLLQQREFAQAKRAAGLIGCFGGKLEAGEQSIDAICREINEETSLQTAPKDFSYIGNVTVTSDHNLQPVTISAKVFLLQVPLTENVTAQEGLLVRLSEQEAEAELAKLTPATRAVFEQFIFRKG